MILTSCLYYCGFQDFFGLGGVFGLFARPEGQRLGKLNRHFAHLVVYIIDPADPRTSRETGQIETFLRFESRNTEPCRKPLTRMRAVFPASAGKCRSGTADIHHMSLGQGITEILGEPDGPVIPQSSLCPSFVVYVFHALKPRCFLFVM